METATYLNKAQIAVLGALSALKTEEEVDELRKVITQFLAKRIDDEMDRLWNEGVITQEIVDSWATAHFRTPYE